MPHSTQISAGFSEVGRLIKAANSRLVPTTGTTGNPLVKTASGYAFDKIELAAINAPANSDGLYLKVSGGVLVAAAGPAASGGQAFEPFETAGSGTANQTITLPISGLTVKTLFVTAYGLRLPFADYTVSGTTLTIIPAIDTTAKIAVSPTLGQKGDPGTGGGGGATYTAGTGIAISGSNEIAIDATKVARKDIGQTHAGDHIFSGTLASPYLRSLNGESGLQVYGGYIDIDSTYGVNVQSNINLNGEANFNDTINVNGDFFINGHELRDLYESINSTVFNEPTINITPNYQASTLVRCTSNSDVTVTTPNFGEVGLKYHFIQAGSGRVSFVAGSGHTIQSYLNYRKIAGQYAMVTLMKVDTNVWQLLGPLVA